MRGLHGDLGVEPTLLDQLEEPQVVLDHGVGVDRVPDVLPEIGERGGDPVLGEACRRVEGIIDPLGMNRFTVARTKRKRAGARSATVPRGEEQRIPHRVHGSIASTSRPARRPVSITPSM